MNAEDIKSELKQFYGTQQWHRLSWNLIATDGAKFVADSCRAYWLMDVISSWQVKRHMRAETFQVWRLTVKKGTGIVQCDDGNGRLLAKQKIPYTDFPLEEIELYFDNGVVMLPSEY